MSLRKSPKPHQCDEKCVCHQHETPLPLMYAPGTDEHACVDPDCINAHGITDTVLSRTLEAFDVPAQMVYPHQVTIVEALRDGKTLSLRQSRKH